MYYLVLLVLHDVAKLEAMLNAWEAAGVSGVTVIPTTGIGRIREKFALQEDMPLIPSLDSLLADPREEMLNRTLFSIVEDEALVDRLVEASEAVLGNMNVPRTGILAVIELAMVHGLNRNWKKPASQEVQNE